MLLVKNMLCSKRRYQKVSMSFRFHINSGYRDRGAVFVQEEANPHGRRGRRAGLKVRGLSWFGCLGFEVCV